MTTEFTARMRLVARLSALFSLILVSIHFEKSSNYILRRVLRSAIAIAFGRHEDIFKRRQEQWAHGNT